MTTTAAAKEEDLLLNKNTVAEEKESSLCSKIGRFVLNNYLPLSLIFFVVLGALLPQLGHALDHKATRYICVIYIFMYCGLYLRTGEIKEALLAYKAVIWGIISILGITCIVGGQLTALLISRDPYNGGSYNTSSNSSIHNETESHHDLLGPIEFRYGLQIYVIMPCTISSGVVMVSQLNGHFALAILLTVVTNITAVLTIPLYVKWMLVPESDVQFDVPALLLKLTLTILIPIIVGKCLGLIKPLRKFLDIPKHKMILKLINTTFLAFIVWFTVSTTGVEGKLDQLTVVSILFVIGWAIAMHLLFLLINTVASFVLRLEVDQRKCIIILASQKTLAVGVSIIVFLPKSLGEAGLIAIAIVISHITTLLFDSLLIGLWLNYERNREQQKSVINDKDEAYVIKNEIIKNDDL